MSSAVEDSWGVVWESEPREAVEYATAVAECQAIGGRLPTMTELYRVSGSTGGDGSMALAGDDGLMWTQVPIDSANQIVASLADGVATSGGLGDNYSFRCVCEREEPVGFDGADCNGPAGEPCFDAGGSLNVDARDRPAMPKSSAVWECRNEGGHLAGWDQLAAAIGRGLAGGSGQPLQVSNNSSWDATTSVAWSGVDTDWQTTDGLSFQPLGGSFPFRCVGHASDPAIPVAAGLFVDPQTGFRIEQENSTDSVLMMDASATCNDAGGHIPSMSEWQELLAAGLGGGRGLVHASDHVAMAGTLLHTGRVRWQGTNRRHGYLYDATAETPVTANAKMTATAEYRCLRYALLSDTETTPPTCSGGSCFEFAFGPATMRFDNADRGPALVADAVRDCDSLGGRLPSERDMVEALSHGLKSGATYLWTSDSASLYDATQRLVIKLVHPALPYQGYYLEENIYPGGFAHSTWSEDEDPRHYRCMWTNERR